MPPWLTDLEISKMRRPWLALGCCVRERERESHIRLLHSVYDTKAPINYLITSIKYSLDKTFTAVISRFTGLCVDFRQVFATRSCLTLRIIYDYRNAYLITNYPNKYRCIQITWHVSSLTLHTAAVCLTPRSGRFTSRKGTQYPLHTKLGGRQCRYKWMRKISPHRDSILRPSSP